MADNAVTQVLKKGKNVKANPRYSKLFDEFINFTICDIFSSYL